MSKNDSNNKIVIDAIFVLTNGDSTRVANYDDLKRKVLSMLPNGGSGRHYLNVAAISHDDSDLTHEIIMAGKDLYFTDAIDELTGKNNIIAMPDGYALGPNAIILETGDVYVPEVRVAKAKLISLRLTVMDLLRAKGEKRIRPIMAPDAYMLLVRSIDMYGYDPNRPIIMDKGTNLVLDGYHRNKAAKELGIEATVAFVEGDLIKNFFASVDADLPRLTPGARKKVGERLTELGLVWSDITAMRLFIEQVDAHMVTQVDTMSDSDTQVSSELEVTTIDVTVDETPEVATMTSEFVKKTPAEMFSALADPSSSPLPSAQTRKGKKRKSADEKQLIMQHAGKGWSDKQIADELNFSTNTVYSIIEGQIGYSFNQGNNPEQIAALFNIPLDRVHRGLVRMNGKGKLKFPYSPV